MSSLHLLLLMGAFMALTTAQPRCDPQTQYEQNNDCCNMCGKGTSMTSSSTCKEPQCKACLDGEYQDGHTKELKCEPQPYCDPNLNFEVTVHQSKEKKTICKCKEGFHCSSEDCKTCVPHKTCPPGYEAQPKGNHNHDTNCKECPEGTFSKETSWNSICKKWTECDYVKQEGTAISDNTCALSRIHIIAICLLAVGVVIVALIVFFLCRGRLKENAKPCIELCRKDEHQTLRETREPVIRAPEENEAEPSLQEMTSEGLLTDMGNPVREEYGKSEILSRQESQTEAF